MSLSGEELIAKLIEAGTPAELIAEVAMQLAKSQAAVEILETRKAKDRARKRSTEIQGTPRKSKEGAEIRDTPPKVSPKNNIQTPSSPPAQGSEPNGSSPSPRAWSLPAGVSLQVWQDFKKNRERKRLPNTETAWKTFNDDLKRVSAQTGIPPPELIERCAAKGWASINDPRDERDKRNERSNNPTAEAVHRILGQC